VAVAAIAAGSSGSSSSEDDQGMLGELWSDLRTQEIS
jgi:hypothetical protein